MSYPMKGNVIFSAIFEGLLGVTLKVRPDLILALPGVPPRSFLYLGKSHSQPKTKSGEQGGIGLYHLKTRTLVCIYVCIEVALCGVPMEKGVQLWTWGRGPQGFQCSNTAGTIGPTSRTLADTCAKRFLLPILLWAAKGDLYPHIGGTGSHRTHLNTLVWSLDRQL